MRVNLHANARTTPKSRAEIQDLAKQGVPVAEIAVMFGVHEKTIYRWKDRTSVQDRSHKAHKLAIAMSPEEEALVVELRTSLGLPLDDIVEVMHRCVNRSLSRSGIYRCLARNGISGRLQQDAPRTIGAFEEASVGFIHIDLKHLTRLEGRPSYVFAAIDRATRFVYIEILATRDAPTVAACLERFIASFPHKVHTILTDNGAEFTDRFASARWTGGERKPTGQHSFDRVCSRHAIEHRLTRPFKPQTNGMIERFNRRLGEAIAARKSVAKNEGKNKFLTHADRDAFLLDFVANYNRTRLKCLGYQAPAQLLANPPECNTEAATQVRGLQMLPDWIISHRMRS